jgi:glyoxylate/hydroxypyruvate reductase A
MGGAAADMLSEAGYHVSSWTRTTHDHEGVTCYHGSAELQEFVSTADVLVCLLPLTSATRGIINAQLLSWLPRGATLVNAARGAHVVEGDLLAALDEGQVRCA